MAGTILFPNVFSVNTLTHRCTSNFNFHAFCRLGKSEIAKSYVFYFGPKTAKLEIKQRNDKNSRFIACQIIEGFS